MAWGGGVTVDIQEAARHPVLYDNFYLVQYLLGQIYTSGNCRPVIKQNLKWQLPASSFYMLSAGGVNIQVLIIIALTNFNRRGIFVWGPFYSASYFLKVKELQNNFSRIWRACFLWSVVSGFSFPGVRFARHWAGAPRPNKKSEWTWTAQRLQSKRKPEYNSNRPVPIKQTAKNAESSYAIKRKNKPLIADLYTE